MNIDYEKLFKDNTSNEIINIVKKVSIKQKSENVPDEQIVTEIIEFLVNQIKTEEFLKIKECNNIISNNIKELSLMKQWTNLISISKHALEMSIKTKEKSINRSLGLKLRYDILNSGLSELKGVFNKEWLKKNYSDIYDKIEKD